MIEHFIGQQYSFPMWKTCTVDTSDSGFKVTATYSGRDEKAPKSLSIDQTMQISSN